MIRAFCSGVDVQTSTAATVFGVPEAEVTSEMRKRAKAVTFGILYGIGAFSLADDLGISRVQAQEYIDLYLASYPAIDAYLKKTIADAYETGYVTTLFGRKRYIPELAGKNKTQRGRQSDHPADHRMCPKYLQILHHVQGQKIPYPSAVGSDR